MKNLLAFALLLASLAPAAAAQTTDSFTGKWEGTFTRTASDGTERSQAIVFNLTQKGKALTGTAGPPDQQTDISKGEVNGGKGAFEVSLPSGQSFKFTLTIVKTRLQGDMVGERDGVVTGTAKVDAAKAATAKM